MITAQNNLVGKISAKQNIIGKLNNAVIKEYPELENLTVIPSTEQQTFKSGKYGYDEVIVEKVTSEIDENIKPENIKEGTRILGIDGQYSGIDTSNATATAEDLLKGKIAYANNQEITGTIETYDGSFEGSAETASVKITDASYLFCNGARFDYKDEILKLLENVTNMSYMFNNCHDTFILNYDLTIFNINNLDTSKVTDMTYMFENCRSSKNIIVSNFDTSNVTRMTSMFSNCGKLTSLDLSNFDTSKVTYISSMFNYCYKLTNLKFGINLGKGYTQQSNNYRNYTLDLSYSTNLTHDSLMNVINNLYDLNLTYDVANGGTLYTQSLQLGSTNKAKLTAEEIAIATNKGWTVT